LDQPANQLDDLAWELEALGLTDVLGSPHTDKHQREEREPGLG
jgi:hypothetical protein